MGLFALALFCLLSLTCYGHSTNKHMICKDVGDVFADVTNSEGSKGEKGFPDCQPGTIDYDRVQKIVRLKVKEETRRLRVKVDGMGIQVRQLKSQISALRETEPNTVSQTTGPWTTPRVTKPHTTSQTTGPWTTPRVTEPHTTPQATTQPTTGPWTTPRVTEPHTTPQTTGPWTTPRVTEPHTTPQATTQPTTVVRCGEGVIHEGICYWGEVHWSLDTNYAEAERICFNKDSTLADIYGKVHYDLIMNYLRQKLHGSSSKRVWTGMKKIYKNNIAQSNGSPAPYTRQRGRPWWDDADSSWTHVYLLVKSSTNDPDQGMGAYIPTQNRHGALCQTK